MKTKQNKEYFPRVIGQKRAKIELGFYLDNHLERRTPMPHFLFIGSKGDGKTHLVRAMAKTLPDRQNPRRAHKAFYSFNASAILNPTMFFEDICDKVQGQYCTIFIDEAHELNKKIQTILLTVLEPNANNETRYTFNDVEYVFDFNLITFMFATTETQLVNHALRDRLTPIALEPYTEEDLAEIIELVIDNRTKFEAGLLPKIAHYVRRNARSADRMAKNILSFRVPTFRREHFKTLKEKLNLFPYGVTHDEVRVLEVLRTDGSCALNRLASRLACQPKALQQSTEPYLIATRLMEIEGTRHITGLGKQFLDLIK